jgi:hypothetical protein
VQCPLVSLSPISVRLMSANGCFVKSSSTNWSGKALVHVSRSPPGQQYDAADITAFYCALI